MKKIIFIFFFSACFVGIQAQTPWYTNGNGSTTSSDFIGTTASQPLIFKTNGIERMQLLPNKSFLGIGVSNPLATMHLHYQVGVDPPTFLELLQLTSDITGSGSGKGFRILSHKTTNDIIFKQQEAAKFFIEGKNGGMVIAQDGKIGVGTDAPEEKVHVNEGNMLISCTTDGPTNTPVGALLFDNFPFAFPHGQEIVRWCIEYLNYSKVMGLNFRKYGNLIGSSGDVNSVLFLSNNERVGIGTKAPQERLDIAGTLRSTGASIEGTLTTSTLNAQNASITNLTGTTTADDFKVTGLLCAKEIRVMRSGAPCWPDYVFSKAYNLMSLQELEQFVHKNQHLPNVPSAAEVETNGIDLGEMNAILLKKMEEMTLYILDLQKQIDELKNR